MTTIRTLSLVAVAYAAMSLAQAPQANPKLAESRKAASEGLYLKGWRLLKEALAEVKSDDDKNMIRSSLSKYAPFVGEIMAARQYEADSQEKPELKPIPVSNMLEGAERIGALEAIIKESKGRRIVIINEEHNSTQCRAFGMQVVRALYKEGFKTLGIETLSENLPQSVKVGYPLSNIGNYTRDPYFNDLVRQSMRLGYKLVEYETHDFSAKGDSFDRINFRETDQASHLIDRVLKKDSSVRLLLYVGYSHATKALEKLDDGRELIWLAARLKRMTGIDPLTIDQTAMSERASATFENMYYRFADAKGWLKKPIMFRTKNGKWLVSGDYENGVDMQVFHPRSVMQLGRADWMRMGNYRHDVLIKSSWLPSSGEVLIQAFVASEGKLAMPMDQVIVTTGQPAPVLLLPHGKYRIEAQDDQGNIRSLDLIEVKNP